MIIIQIAAFVVVILVIFFGAILSHLLWKRRDRYQRNIFIVMTLCVFSVVLGEYVWSPIKCLAIPIFIFGWFWATYDALITEPESDTL